MKQDENRGSGSREGQYVLCSIVFKAFLGQERRDKSTCHGVKAGIRKDLWGGGRVKVETRSALLASSLEAPCSRSGTKWGGGLLRSVWTWGGCFQGGGKPEVMNSQKLSREGSVLPNRVCKYVTLGPLYTKPGGGLLRASGIFKGEDAG